ncbi:MAG: alpha-hydroxy acid oxidase [Longimicrobiales bacterium]|nr:alpha-hydroxy acid oxidase [Longimicrobiales bacterium]
MTTEPTPLPPNVRECQEAARAVLAREVYEYYARGAEDEVTLRENEAAFRGLRFRPRVLVDVSDVDTSCTLMGARLPSPVLLAPTAFQRLCHPEGEAATARGAGAGGHLMVASALSTRSIEEIAAAAAAPLWLQLYVFRDRALSEELVRRAVAAGCRAVCLTVDVPVAGNREHDARNHFSLGDRVTMANFEGPGPGRFPAGRAGSGLAAFIAEQFDATLTWEAVAWLREVAGVPVILKGIQHPGDAERAVEAGADALVVSNHGGRQLDGAEPAITLLPDVVAAVRGEVPVLMDGGIRRGSDVARALCLGAAAVLVGRPYLWGLTLAGAEGVAHVLGILDRELRRTMALLGARSLGELGPDRLAPLSPRW